MANNAVVDRIRSGERSRLRLLLVILALTPFAALADTFLCVPDAGAMVKDREGTRASAHIADVSREKFILKQENGKWVVKRLGLERVLLDKCVIPDDGGAPGFCELDGLYTGTFWRSRDGRFWITEQGYLDGFEIMRVSKGRCSKI